ncbi:hypothetical protein AX14_006153 [Amanita brunnescens Koide BX004]|nr:hypothetical protein AX14_006153 [Amanita brunnescens Koide BX004]
MADAKYTIRAPEAGLYIASYGDVGRTVEYTPIDFGNVFIISPPLKKGSEVFATIKGTLSRKYLSPHPLGPPPPGELGTLAWSDKPYEWKISDKTVSTVIGRSTHFWYMQYNEAWRIVLVSLGPSDFDIVEV